MRRATISNYIQMTHFGITVVIAIATAILSDSCFFDTKSTLCEVSGLRCPSGWTCSADQMSCIQGGCGDAVKRGEEECDDGNTRGGDGCSADCKLEICGNGIIDPHEECDGQENCSPDCRLKACGNGIVDTNEDCDSLAIDSIGCDKDCSFVMCGDGYTNSKAGEECDDGPQPSASCNSPVFCKKSICGDNYHNSLAGEECDTGKEDTVACNGNKNASGIGNCHRPKCGDSYINTSFVPLGAISPEECDDGDENDIDGDGISNNDTIPDACRTNCHKAFCGDGVLDTVITATHIKEDCDNGNNLSHDLDGDGNINSDTTPDACRTNCKLAFCGDGVLDTVVTATHAKENCDNGNDLSHDLDHDHNINSDTVPNACRSDCRKAFCGDGVIDNNEQCDPGGNYGNGPQGCPSNMTCVNGCKACIITQ